jgi:hypothetical protein
MIGTTFFYQYLRRAAPWIGGVLLCGLLAIPPNASAKQTAITAQMVQQQVAAIEARFKARKPFLERSLEDGEGGWDVFSWGTPTAVEKIAAKYQGERGELLYDFYWREGVLIAARLRRIDYGAYVGELPAKTPLARNVLKDERFEFVGEVVLRRRSFGRAAPVSAMNVGRVLAELKAGALSYKRLMDIPETNENKLGICRWSCMRKEADVCLAYECK